MTVEQQTAFRVRWWHRALLVVVALIVPLVAIELLSAVVLFALSLRSGATSAVLPALLPHPALAARLPVWQGAGTGAADRVDIENWHPIMGWYHPRLRHGEARPGPTFQPNEVMVYLFGGSTVEGDGASTRERTIAARLEHYLRAGLQAAHPDSPQTITVVNEGISSYTSSEELLLFITKTLQFGNPRYVIALDGYNDWYTPALNLATGRAAGGSDGFWPQPGLYYHFKRLAERNVWTQLGTSGGAVRSALAMAGGAVAQHTYTGWLWSQASTWYRFRVVGANDAFDFAATPTVPRERAAFHVRNARIMTEACRANGCDVLWALQPILPCPGPATAEEHDIFGTRPAVYWQSLEQYYRDVKDLVHSDRQYWDGRFADLSCLPGDAGASRFLDTVHLTEAGQDRVARELADVLLPTLVQHAAPRSTR